MKTYNSAHQPLMWNGYVYGTGAVQLDEGDVSIKKVGFVMSQGL